MHVDNDQKISREIKKIQDHRIHLILFFLDGHRCKELDFKSIKALQQFASIIPILAKADQYNQDEIKQMKMDV
jgi:septin family protein